MDLSLVDEAVTWLEKANADLEPELLSAHDARALLTLYARAEKLAAFGKTTLSRKLDDAAELARVSGTSMGKARTTVETARILTEAPRASDAFSGGELSLDQAQEIAGAELARPDAAEELVALAQEEPFHVLRNAARRVRLEAEQHRDLAERQRAARSARSHRDELGMIHLHLAFEPHVGTPIVARAEAEAARMQRDARRESRSEPFQRHLADAFAALLAGSGRGSARRPELVVLVSHEVARRGWSEVKDGEVCKIPGVGPVPPPVAKRIAEDAFLTGLFYDGTDLRHLRRWTRNTPVEVRLALELGPPPDFDGIVCTDCGNRFRTENDHTEPHIAGGPASLGNLHPRCWSCHRAKTKRDRRSGRLKPAEP